MCMERHGSTRNKCRVQRCPWVGWGAEKQSKEGIVVFHLYIQNVVVTGSRGEDIGGGGYGRVGRGVGGEGEKEQITIRILPEIKCCSVCKRLE